MNENILSWNVTNWVTVLLMVAAGYYLVSAILKWRQQKTQASVPSQNTTVPQTVMNASGLAAG